MTTPATQNARDNPPANEDLQRKAIQYTSWGCLIAGPILIVLPPRKLDLYTLGLLLCTFVGGNQVSREQTGISIIDRIGQRLESSTSTLPPKALEIQRRAREERQNLIRDVEKKNMKKLDPPQTGREGTQSGLLRKVWMGSEGDNWKEERLQKEREALESGKGYFDLIMEQVWEVWNGEKNNQEERGIHYQSNGAESQKTSPAGKEV